MSEWASNIQERSEARTKRNLDQFAKSTITPPPFHLSHRREIMFSHP